MLLEAGTGAVGRSTLHRPASRPWASPHFRPHTSTVLHSDFARSFYPAHIYSPQTPFPPETVNALLSLRPPIHRHHTAAGRLSPSCIVYPASLLYSYRGCSSRLPRSLSWQVCCPGLRTASVLRSSSAGASTSMPPTISHMPTCNPHIPPGKLMSMLTGALRKNAWHAATSIAASRPAADSTRTTTVAPSNHHIRPLRSRRAARYNQRITTRRAAYVGATSAINPAAVPSTTGNHASPAAICHFTIITGIIGACRTSAISRIIPVTRSILCVCIIMQPYHERVEPSDSCCLYASLAASAIRWHLRIVIAESITPSAAAAMGPATVCPVTPAMTASIRSWANMVPNCAAM